MRVLFAIATIFTVLITAFSQAGVPNELHTLQKQIPVLTKEGKLVELIEVGEKILRFEKAAGPSNQANYIIALQNLARWKRQWLENPKTRDGKRPVSIVADVDETVKLLEELVAIAEKGKDPMQLAMAQTELASLLMRFRSSTRIKDIQTLLLQSISLREQVQGLDATSTLTAVGKLAEFYFDQGELELFLPLARRVVASVDKANGVAPKALVPYLNLYADFLATIDRESEAMEFSKRISPTNDRKPVAGKTLNRRAVENLDVGFGEAPRSAESLSGSDVSYNSRVVRSGNQTRIVNDGRLRRSGLVSVADASTFQFDILINESGSVIEVYTDPALDKKVVDQIRDRAMKWKFRPFVYEGRPQRMRARIFATLYHN